MIVFNSPLNVILLLYRFFLCVLSVFEVDIGLEMLKSYK